MPAGTSLVGSLSSLLGQAEARTNARLASKELGKDAFLRLLTTQLKNQDPLKPMEDAAFIAEMAQFSSLEQMQNLNKLMEAQTQFASLSQASTMIGKHVTLVTPGENAETVKGVVSEVRQVGGVTKVVVDGRELDASSIQAVTSAPAQAAG
ncbi:MAG: flagellar hook capping FlgD N-terminal domain-containing protein [Candidatus Sericytochromatia bacterium]|nr:flagellar hook capping FlgD N-terminal domain-containing protein [Candidatus Sericytochromatia bacterium]